MSITTKFETVYKLFAQAVVADVLDSAFILPIEQEFRKIATAFPSIDFERIQQENPLNTNVQKPSYEVKRISDGVSKERFIEIVRATVLAEEAKQYTDNYDKARAQIEALSTPPETWKATKKEWETTNKETLIALRNTRDENRSMATAFRNDELNEAQQNVVNILVNELYTKQNGVPTQEQVNNRLQYLLDRCFIEESSNEQFFPTPHDIVENRLLSMQTSMGVTVAQLLESGVAKKVLEPSAGRGNIADALRQHAPLAEIDVCEINPIRREILELKNYNLIGDNFLSVPPSEQYDVIVMNPPFNNGEDIRHVKQAYKHLKPGGVLCALLSEGSVWSEGRKDAVGFRNWISRNSETSKLDIIYEEEYNKEHDRKILINIGVVFMQKKAQAEATITNRSSGIQLVKEFAENVIDISKFNYVPTTSEFVKAEVIVSNPELSRTPKNNVIPVKYNSLPFLKQHVKDGVNLAIESLDKIGGFLCADGTGSGKTMTCLLTAEHYYRTTGKPVLMFTVDDRVIQSGVFGDAQKLGMDTPDKIELSEDNALKPKRPKNYTGLYDNADTDKPTQVRLFKFGYKQLFDGINVCTYNELSQWTIVDSEMKEVELLRSRVKLLDAQYREKRKELKETADAMFPKDKNGKREPGMKDYLAQKGAEIEKAYINEPLLVEMASAETKLKEARLESARALLGECSLIIYDEAHKVKNVGKIGDATSARAEMAFALSSTSPRVMFVTATPCDRAGDILYLQKAGLFQTTEQFEQLMNSMGFEWSKVKTNDKGDVIRHGYWKPPNDKFPAELVAEHMGRAFDTLTEDGHMIRRELELRNLDVNMVNVDVPSEAFSLMTDIEENLTPDEGVPNVGLIYMEQLFALEKYKLAKCIELTQEAVSKGHSVIIWCASVDEGTTEKASTGMVKDGNIRTLKDTFAKIYGEDAVGVIVGTKNEYENYRRLENVQDFQDRKRRILIGTITSGGTGLNLDDQVGDAPRTMIVVTSPLSFINVVQAVGRIVRNNTKSRSYCNFLFAGSVDVDDWLKNLLASKFTTLNATVKGEMKSLNMEAMRQAENAGSEAIISTADSPVFQKNKHSRYTESNKRFEGWELISRSNIYVELSGTPRSTLISIGTRSKEELAVWAKENASFIQQYGLTLNPDENYRQYHGRYYGREFRDRKQIFELWNACLNLVMPESFAYRTSTVSAFNEGDVVTASASIAWKNVAFGAEGIIEKVRRQDRTIDAKGTTVAEWYYDVWFDGELVKRLEGKYLLPKVGEPVLKKGMVFRDKDSTENDIYTFTVETADNYEVVGEYKNRWKFSYNNDWRETTREATYDVPEFIANIASGGWICENCNEFSTEFSTNPQVVETTNQELELEGVADNGSTLMGVDFCNRIKSLKSETVTQQRNNTISFATAQSMLAELERLEALHCRSVSKKTAKSAMGDSAENSGVEPSAIANDCGCDNPTLQDTTVACPPMEADGKTRCITDSCIAQLDECIENEKPTKWLHFENGSYTKEREALHQKIVNEFTANKPCQNEKPICILTGGASGSGKSFLLKKLVPNLNEFMIVDIDAMREHLPEYKGWNANATQEEVKDIYNQVLETVGKDCNYNIVIDGTMNKSRSYLPLLQKIKNLGYEVYIMYVQVTKEQSIERAMARYQKTGRYVPKFVIDEIFYNGLSAFNELKEQANGHVLIDNTGTTPTFVEQNNWLYSESEMLGESMKVDLTTGNDYGNDRNAEYFSLVARYSAHIEDDIKRNWSSWNFGAEGFVGTKQELDAKLNDVRKNGSVFTISAMDIYQEDIDNWKFGELYKNYWVAIDTRGKGISTHVLEATTINEALKEVATTSVFDGTGDGVFIDMQAEDTNPEVIYSQFPKGEWGLHIISIDTREGQW